MLPPEAPCMTHRVSGHENMDNTNVVCVQWATPSRARRSEVCLTTHAQDKHNCASKLQGTAGRRVPTNVVLHRQLQDSPINEYRQTHGRTTELAKMDPPTIRATCPAPSRAARAPDRERCIQLFRKWRQSSGMSEESQRMPRDDPGLEQS